MKKGLTTAALNVAEKYIINNKVDDEDVAQELRLFAYETALRYQSVDPKLREGINFIQELVKAMDKKVILLKIREAEYKLGKRVEVPLTPYSRGKRVITAVAA